MHCGSCAVSTESVSAATRMQALSQGGCLAPTAVTVLVWQGVELHCHIPRGAAPASGAAAQSPANCRALEDLLASRPVPRPARRWQGEHVRAGWPPPRRGLLGLSPDRSPVGKWGRTARLPSLHPAVGPYGPAPLLPQCQARRSPIASAEGSRPATRLQSASWLARLARPPVCTTATIRACFASGPVY